MLSKTDRMGRTIRYRHDAQGRLISKTFPDNTRDLFTYDVHSNLTSVTGRNSTIQFSHDATDRLVRVVYPGNQTVTYAYDARGNRTQLVQHDRTAGGDGHELSGACRLGQADRALHQGAARVVEGEEHRAQVGPFLTPRRRRRDA